MIRLTTIPMERPHEIFAADYRKARFVLLTSIAARLEIRCHHFGNGDERETATLEIQVPVDTGRQRYRARGLMDALLSGGLLQAVEIRYGSTGEYDWLAGFFEMRDLEMPSSILPPPRNLSDLQFSGTGSPWLSSKIGWKRASATPRSRALPSGPSRPREPAT